MPTGEPWLLETGIPELNKLLGGAIPAGTSILIRGGPGSGKTTLALQIISHHLATGDGNGAVLISLETEPKKAVDYANKSFEFGLPTPVRVRSASSSGRFGIIGSDDAGKEKEGSSSAKDFWSARCLVVVDSLNALLPIFYHETHTSPENLDPRVVVQWITSLAGCDSQAVHIYIGEEHGEPGGRPSSILASESFVSDVEILLTREYIAGAQGRPPAGITGVGYSIERILSEQLGEPQALETRSFCRVTKSRVSPNQSRRCCYDIVGGRGLVFYELYPADGRVLLFEENEPQRESWMEFFTRDVPLIYPALRFDMFGRSGLQRTFASQRGFTHIPTRTDLYLASFDTYWVTWYSELCQRWRLADLLGRARYGEEVPRDAEVRRQLAHLVSRVHRACLEEPRPTEAERESLMAGFPFPDGPEGDRFRRRVHEAIARAWEYVREGKGRSGLLQEIDPNALRLYGELRSGIIKELDVAIPPRNTSIRQPPGPQPAGPSENDLRDERKEEPVIAVPYDANISFIVYRKDLLRDILDRSAAPSVIEEKILEAYRASCRYLGDEEDPRATEVASQLVRDLRRGDAPKTWEEVIALCRIRRAHFLIETQTFDTFLGILLEVLWGTGGDLIVRADYSIEGRECTERSLLHTFHILDTLFEAEIIPRNSSLEASYLAHHFSEGGRKRGGRADWLFARHWYSTLNDVLCKKKPDASERSPFVWEPGPIQIELMPFPITLAQFLRDPRTPHRSLWGEWYLGILAGSENLDLGIDLVNNLMSSQKICERAFRNANLPTVERFYDLYGDVRCFNIPGRDDIALPRIKFNEIREEFFTHARSRSQIFDYRHCMRGLYAVLEYINAFPGSRPKDMRRRIDRALDAIEQLRDKDVLHK